MSGHCTDCGAVWTALAVNDSIVPVVFQLRSATPADARLLLEIERRTVQIAYAHIFEAEKYPFPEQVVLADGGVCWRPNSPGRWWPNWTVSRSEQ